MTIAFGYLQDFRILIERVLKYVKNRMFKICVSKYKKIIYIFDLRY